MKTNTLRKDVDGSTALNSESDQESSIDIVDDDDSRSRTPEDAESISTGDGLIIMRPPKPSNADLRTAEVFESHSSETGRVVVPMLMAAALSLGAFFLQRHWRRKKRAGSHAPQAPGLDYTRFIQRLGLQPGEESSSLLRGLTVVASNLLWSADGGAPAASEEVPRVLQQLLDQGAEISGRTVTEERCLGLLSRTAATLNDALPESIASGTGSAEAMAAAAGLADVAIGLDHLSGPRVHAACNGVWGYRASTGTGPADSSASIAGALDAVGWTCRHSQDLQLIGEALNLPGTADKGDLLQVIVAEDLFERIGGDSAKLLMRATYKAARRWAGQDEVARARMMSFLYDACPSARHFMRDPEDDRGIMEGLQGAAAAVQAADFARAHERLLDQPGSTPVAVMQELKQAAKMDAGAAEQGRRVMAEASTQLREILVAGNLLILPVLPGPPPARDAPQEELQAWERSTLQLSCLAPLAGLPQVTVPVVLPDVAPMAVGIVGLQRSDRRLLAAAQQLGPLIQEAAAKLAASRAAAADAPTDSSSAAGSPAKPLANGSAKKQSPGKRPAAGAGKQAAQEQAEAHKADGNAAFQAGAYEEAVRAYTQAAEADPGCAVYWSNRAQAYLKLMQFEAAEADCDKALKLELSVKTLLRRGTARRGKQDIEGARRDFKHALGLEPNNRQARLDLQKLKEAEETLRAYSAADTAMPDAETNGHGTAEGEAIFL